MPIVTIHILKPLIRKPPLPASVQVTAQTLEEAIDGLFEQCPTLDTWFSPPPATAQERRAKACRWLNFYVNDENVRFQPEQFQIALKSTDLIQLELPVAA
jgi:hypothetical protein